MKIVVDKMPDSPRECLFSHLCGCDSNGSVYLCKLLSYCPEVDKDDIGLKEERYCKDVNTCPYLKSYTNCKNGEDKNE